MLTRDQILKAKDIPMEKVSVPEWGGEVMVKGLSGKERDWFELSVFEQKGRNQKVNMANLRAKLASLSICDEEGNRLFSEDDVEELAKKSAVALQRVFSIAQRLSGLSNEEAEILAKN